MKSRFAITASAVAALAVGVLISSEGKADQPPPAHSGFQLALRTGYAIPLGSFDDEPGADMSKIYSGQVPFIVDIGGKIGKYVFLGGYLGLGIGGTGDLLSPACDLSGASCATATFRTGIEVEYNFLPDRLANPWVGYGIGYESSAAGISVPGQSDRSFSGQGIEFAHLLGGVDFRLGRVFGIGPFVDFSVGEYFHAHIDVGNSTALDGSIDQTAIHEWLTFGVRGVFFP
jgi:hypothetical protein